MVICIQPSDEVSALIQCKPLTAESLVADNASTTAVIDQPLLVIGEYAPALKVSDGGSESSGSSVTMVVAVLVVDRMVSGRSGGSAQADIP